MTGDPNTNNHGVSNEVSIKSFQVVDYEDEPWIKRKSSQKIRRKCPTVMISCLGEEVEAVSLEIRFKEFPSINNF